jgi:hypothetical protein
VLFTYSVPVSLFFLLLAGAATPHPCSSGSYVLVVAVFVKVRDSLPSVDGGERVGLQQ